jgi:hypothetical protein
MMPTTLTSAGISVKDLFFVAIDTSGTVTAATRYGDAGTQTAEGIAAGDDGELFITGNFLDTLDFGGGAEPITAEGTSAFDIFVAAVSDTGEGQWAPKFGNNSAQTVQAIAARGGRIALTGALQGTFTFGSVPVAGSDDTLFVAQLDATGAPTGVVLLAGPGAQAGLDVDVGPGGVVGFCGQFEGTLEQSMIESLGGKDALVGLIGP